MVLTIFMARRCSPWSRTYDESALVLHFIQCSVSSSRQERRIHVACIVACFALSARESRLPHSCSYSSPTLPPATSCPPHCCDVPQQHRNLSDRRTVPVRQSDWESF